MNQNWKSLVDCIAKEEVDRKHVRNLPPEKHPRYSRRTRPHAASSPDSALLDAETESTASWEILPPAVPNLPTETSSYYTVDPSHAIHHVASMTPTITTWTIKTAKVRKNV
ncbi:hypothetical protein PV11_06371 [Exophiala sideris]|uniref:Uncharacterized protein n=1 Tax=Exophiala sideris TaxID=1016849 RepID=A0A0D1YD68_9EURO|nr:hypothetical protein PV11_06371 [Exophiala sideris]